MIVGLYRVKTWPSLTLSSPAHNRYPVVIVNVPLQGIIAWAPKSMLDFDFVRVV